MLIPDLVFPVYKIDRKHLVRKNISKERLKIPKRYSEAVVFENFLKGLNILYEKGPFYLASVIVA